jgi:DNA-binding MarR family transcriptional regulator
MGNDLEFSIGYIIGTTRRLILKKLNEAFVKNNIPITIEQFIFLSTLKDQSGDVTQQDMACLTCKDKSAILRTIDILEKKGLVKRQAASDDRRKNTLIIAEGCEDLFAQIIKIEKEITSSLKEGISDTDYEAMLRALDKIQHNAR